MSFQAGNAQNGGSVKALPVQNGVSKTENSNGQDQGDVLDEVLDILPLPAMVAPPSPEAPTCRKEELVPDETVFESIDEQVIKVDLFQHLSHGSFRNLFQTYVRVTQTYWYTHDSLRAKAGLVREGICYSGGISTRKL